MRLGKVLRNYRRMRDMGLREMAKEFGIGAATLMRIEQGYVMDGLTLAKILKWLLEKEN